jgi:hypothetical protein
MENLQHKNGVIILMDEPDNFLSATGQRSLLRVFETLISNKVAHSPCQLVYTTHSPFLINRNFPGRIRLVRKGDGTEGTQFVQRAAVRRFEPVRSALAIDSADTLFLGSINVVLEGASDQKLLTACVQRFGEPSRIDQVLYLNSITIVSADSAKYVPQFVRKAMKGDENPPIVVVLLDGDETGAEAAREVAEIIHEKQVCTLREIEVNQSVFQVLEDLVPDPLLAAGIESYFKREHLECAATFSESIKGINNAERIVAFCKNNAPELANLGDTEIRAGVIECLTELIADGLELPGQESLQNHVEAVCAQLNGMIEHAQRNATRHSLKKLLRQQIETFFKRFQEAASKRDIKKLLGDLEHVASGPGDDAKQTRNNISMLIERLDVEANKNSDPVNIESWRDRLSRLRDEPWARVKDWTTVVGPKRKEPALQLDAAR